MEQHYQVINLHNIIRSQQAKIQELKQELRIANEREENRYSQIVENNQVAVLERDKMIKYLKQEIQKLQSQSTNAKKQENQEVQKEIMTYKKKCIQLQGKIKRVQKEAETKILELIEHNQKLTLQIQHYNSKKSSLTTEISKLNHFYKNSLFEISKRKQTLLWVDKFTEYLQQSQLKQKEVLQDVSNFIKSSISSIKSSLSETITSAVKTESDTVTFKNNISSQIAKMIQTLRTQINSVSSQNQQFWLQAIRDAKISEKNQEIKALQLEISTLTQKNAQELSDLKSQVKTYESEKKTLLLGFQQLRSLSEQKQSIHRQETRTLKKTIEELLEKAKQKDIEFDNEIRAMMKQIENITDRYYENIESPHRKQNEKMMEDVEIIKGQIIKIKNNGAIKGAVNNLVDIVTQYVNLRIQNGEDFGSGHDRKKDTLLLDYWAKQINANVNKLLMLVKDLKENKLLFQKQIAHERYLRKQMQKAIEQKEIDMREKVNKSNYETLLAKKHLNKMKQYCQSLEKKLGVKNTIKKGDKTERKQQSILDNSFNKKEFMEVYAENQALRQSMQKMKKSHQQQIITIQKRQQNQGQSTSDSFYDILRNTAVKLTQTIQSFQSLIQEQRQKNEQLKQNLKLLHGFLAPIDKFQRFSKEYSQQLNALASSNLNLPNSNENTLNKKINIKNMYTCAEQMKNYKDTILKKTQNSNATNKLLTELIKNIKETISNSKDNKENKDKNLKKEDEVLSRKFEPKFKGIEKRIKEMQNLKLKEKTELLQRIQKNVQNLQKLQSKMNKSLPLKTVLEKFQISFEDKINFILHEIDMKLDKVEIIGIKDQIIADLRSKLNEANNQCQGIRREMSLLYHQKMEKTY